MATTNTGTLSQQEQEIEQEINRIQSAINPVQLLQKIEAVSGSGNEDSKWQQVFAGLNRLPNITPLPTHREMQGLVLFTRPDLNLSANNIINIRYLSHLLSDTPSSAAHAIRRILDPRVHKNDTGSQISNLVDPYSPYISLLTNTLVTMGQPPDIGTSPYASPEGILKEQWMMNEGVAFSNGRYDLTCTFDNIKGAAVMLLFHAWLLYKSYLRIGMTGGLLPHPDNSHYGIMDYFTRIERFKFDETGQYVVQWYHTGAAMPTNLSIGAGFGFNREEAYDQENKTFSVQFACVGAVYQDPIQLLEFNLRYQNLNPRFKDDVRSDHFVRIAHKDAAEYNHVGYPHINLSTLEMEWWVPKATHQFMNSGVSKDEKQFDLSRFDIGTI